MNSINCLCRSKPKHLTRMREFIQFSSIRLNFCGCLELCQPIKKQSSTDSRLRAKFELTDQVAVVSHVVFSTSFFFVLSLVSLVTAIVCYWAYATAVRYRSQSFRKDVHRIASKNQPPKQFAGLLCTKIHIKQQIYWLNKRGDEGVQQKKIKRWNTEKKK